MNTTGNPSENKGNAMTIDPNEENKRLTNLWYSMKSRVGDNRKFQKEEFIEWYKSKRILGCDYCGMLEENLRILAFHLPSKRFPIYSSEKRGRSRCLNLEVDRKVPDGDYSTDNCVLACYFCNNDKSDVFNYVQYMTLLHGEDWQTKYLKSKTDNHRYRYLFKLSTMVPRIKN